MRCETVLVSMPLKIREKLNHQSEILGISRSEYVRSLIIKDKILERGQNDRKS